MTCRTVFHIGVFDDVVSLCETQHSVSSGEEGADGNGNTPIKGVTGWSEKPSRFFVLQDTDIQGWKCW